VSRASVPEQDCAAEEDEEQEEDEADQVEHQAVGADHAAEAEALEKCVLMVRVGRVLGA
jgi:hypothetical protein